MYVLNRNGERILSRAEGYILSRAEGPTGRPGPGRLAVAGPLSGPLIDSRRQGFDADSISQNAGFDEGKTSFHPGTISPQERKTGVNQKIDSLSV